MNKLLSEVLHFVIGWAAQADAFDTTKTSPYLNMGLADRASIFLGLGVGAAGTSTLQVVAASDSSGTGATAIPYKLRRIATGDTIGAPSDVAAAGTATTAGGGDSYVLEVKASDTPDGKPWIALKTTEVVNSPVLSSCLLVAGDLKFAGLSQPTMIA